MEDPPSSKEIWTRCAPADLYYARDSKNSKLMFGTERLNAVLNKFKKELVERGESARSSQPTSQHSPLPKRHRHSRKTCSSKCKEQGGSHSSDSSSEDEDDEDDAIADVIEEMERKMKHPARLHPELWFNDPGEMNDGPLCRCR